MLSGKITSQRRFRWAGIALAAVAGATVFVHAEERLGKWLIHDMSRPRPPVITPGTASTAEKPGDPPSDAIVLFDGKNLDSWVGSSGKPAQWKVENGYMEGAGESIKTKEKFGDVQLHVEWAEPTPATGSSQGRGNSGILFEEGRYEVQVLDNYKNDTYPDGQCAAIYGQNPPLVNACRPPGEWQTYDIVFHAPHFDGKDLKKPATVTVFQNGVLVQDHWSIVGRTFHGHVPTYEAHEPMQPLELQFHGNPDRYRNVWIRPLEKLEYENGGAREEAGTLPEGTKKAE